MYGGDYFGGTEYAGMRNRNTGPIVTVIRKAIRAVYLFTKSITLSVLTNVRKAVLGSHSKDPVQLTTHKEPVTIESKNDKIML